MRPSGVNGNGKVRTVTRRGETVNVVRERVCWAVTCLKSDHPHQADVEQAALNGLSGLGWLCIERKSPQPCNLPHPEIATRHPP